MPLRTTLFFPDLDDSLTHSLAFVLVVHFQISSTSGTRGNVGQVNYSAAKSAVVGMTKTMAKELARYGVRANCVAFGMVETRLTGAKEAGASIVIDGREVSLGIPGAGQKKQAAPGVVPFPDIPLGRPGRVEEAASSILFFASGLSSYITGAVVECSGGRAM